MSSPDVVVADRALAVIAAYAAASSPGVARLQPYALTAARTAATAAARRVGASLTGQDDRPPELPTAGPAGTTADPDAVEVDRHDDGTVSVGVRIVAGTEPPVRDTAEDVARRVVARLHELADVTATVTVHVVDIDPGAVRP